MTKPAITTVFEMQPKYWLLTNNWLPTIHIPNSSNWRGDTGDRGVEVERGE